MKRGNGYQLKKREVYTISIRKSDTEEFKNFFQKQNNISESLRYLIYAFIDKYGAVDISTMINRKY